MGWATQRSPRPRLVARGGGTGTASTAVAVPLLWKMRLSRTKIGAILMTSLRLALPLTPAAQDDKRGEKTKYSTIEALHQLDSSCSVNFSVIAGHLISGT